jgi:hypothetical protein
MKKWLYFLAGILSWVGASAQISLTDSKNSLELSGVMGVLYNYRFYQNPGTNTDFSKNTFSLSTARIKMEGKKGRNWEYRFQFDLARLSNQIRENFPAILDANCTYNGPLSVTMGFQKLPLQPIVTGFPSNFNRIGSVLKFHGAIFSRVVM